MSDFSNNRLVYRDLDGPWGAYRLIIGGTDVTYLRGGVVQLGSYQLTEPYGYGPATFALPMVTELDVGDFGTGDLKWMVLGKPVRLVHVDESDSVVRTIWAGFILEPTVTTGTGLSLDCAGQASGKLSLRDRGPSLFVIKSHIGRRVYDAFVHCRLSLSPYLGGNVGELTDLRGRGGGTYLDFVNGLLADTINESGGQYTVMPKTGGGYKIVQKDSTTTNLTVFAGAEGISLDLSSDMSEQPNAIYGTGISDDGLVWSNEKVPGLVQGPAPDFPNTDDSSISEGDTDDDTDSGSGVSDLIWKLIGMGYLDRRDSPGGYDSDVVAAVKALQRDANLSVNGVVNVATWDALYDEGVTGYSLLQAFQAPLAESSAVRVWNRTSNGSITSRNAGYDPSVVPVDLSVDHGPNVSKAAARAWSQTKLASSQSAKNWAGTITLLTDPAAGSHTHGTTPTQLSRLDVVAGSNVMVRNFDSDTLMHIAVVDVASDTSVRLTVDTQSRDAATLGQVVARRRASRDSPWRDWLKQHRGTDANQNRVQFSEFGGQIFSKVTCPDSQWTVFPVLAGQEGSINRVRTQTSSDEVAFCLAIFAEKVTPAWLNQHVGDPLTQNGDGESKWTDPGVQTKMDTDRVIIGVWGDADNPCGYWPKQHTDSSGDVTSHSVTGLFIDDGTYSYHTTGQPVLWVCIYPDGDTVLKPQRIFWPLSDVY